MIRFKIVKYTHGFKVQIAYKGDRILLNEFCAPLKQYEVHYDARMMKDVRVLKQIFSTFMSTSLIYGLHIGVYTDFIAFLKLKGVSPDEINIEVKSPYIPAESKLILSDSAVPREAQVPIVDFIIEDGTTKILPLQTGGGKTFTTLYAVTKANVRACCIVSNTHVGAWLKDSKWIFTNAEEEFCVVRGKKSLVALINDAKKGRKIASFIIITLRTIQNYLTEYETTEASTYGCIPSELFELLGIGYRVTDEAHENLHFNFRLDMETNVNRALYLSATISSNSPFTNRLYEIIFPIINRYTKSKWNRYALVVGLEYHLDDPSQVKCRGKMGYSHSLYENWICKNNRRLNNYLEMVATVLKKGFVTNYKPGQKALIYFSRVKMCEAMEQYIKRNPAFKDFTCSAFTQEHREVILHTHDIIVSTPQKTGTGKDIKGLTIAISTVGMRAKEKNIQMLGRLRPIDDLYPGISPVYYFLSCMDIDATKRYHHEKISLFRPLVKQITTYSTSFII